MTDEAADRRAGRSLRRRRPTAPRPLRRHPRPWPRRTARHRTIGRGDPDRVLPKTQRVVDLEPRVADVAQPVVHVLLKASANQPADAARGVWRQRVEIGLAAQHAGNRVRRGGAVERAPPRQHLVQHAPEGPHVGSPIDVAPARLLRAQVRGRAHDGQSAVAVGQRCRGRASRAIGGRLRQAEVEQLDGAIAADHDVGGLEVAVHDAAVRARPRARRRSAGPPAATR